MKTIFYGFFLLLLSYPVIVCASSLSLTNLNSLDGQSFQLAYYYVDQTRDDASLSEQSYNTAHANHQDRDFYRLRHKQHDYTQKRTEPRKSAAPRMITKPDERIDSSGHPMFIFNPQEHNWAAYDEEGYLVNYGAASGGRGYCPDIRRGCRTPTGHFSVYRKGGEDCKSTKFPLGKGGAPMQYCMFFKGGYAIHGSNDVPNFNASHGCIRVHPSAAEWLSKQFMRIGTKVLVRSY